MPGPCQFSEVIRNDGQVQFWMEVSDVKDGMGMDLKTMMKKT